MIFQADKIVRQPKLREATFRDYVLMYVLGVAVGVGVGFRFSGYTRYNPDSTLSGRALLAMEREEAEDRFIMCMIVCPVIACGLLTSGLIYDRNFRRDNETDIEEARDKAREKAKRIEEIRAEIRRQRG